MTGVGVGSKEGIGKERGKGGLARGASYRIRAKVGPNEGPKEWAKDTGRPVEHLVNGVLVPPQIEPCVEPILKIVPVDLRELHTIREDSEGLVKRGMGLDEIRVREG